MGEKKVLGHRHETRLSVIDSGSKRQSTAWRMREKAGQVSLPGFF
jgi:hypothetical protein